MHRATILFDLDGTLINSTDAIVQGFNQSLQKLNLPIANKQTITTLIGHTIEDIFLQLNVQQKDILKAKEYYKSFYRAIHKQKTSLLPYAKKAVLLAHSFANIGIVTTKISTNLPQLLEHLQIGQYFDTFHMIGANDVKHPKPNKEPILLAIKRINSDIKNTWMIGDTMLDIESANNANIKSIGVLCGYGNKSEIEKNATFTSKNAFEAVKIIKQQEIK